MREARLPRAGIHEQHPFDTTGAARCRIFVENHTAQKATRVAPSLPVLAEKRRAIALRRANRWFGKHNDPRKAPRHILNMAAETGNYV